MCEIETKLSKLLDTEYPHEDGDVLVRDCTRCGGKSTVQLTKVNAQGIRVYKKEKDRTCDKCLGHCSLTNW